MFISQSKINRFSAPLPSAMLLSGCFLIALLVLLPVRYETNDDFAMVAELSGFLPGSDCFFLNPFTSAALSWLYRLAPVIPWYGLLVYLSACLGAALLLSVIMRFRPIKSLVTFGPILVLVFFHCFCFLSFTSSSLLLLFGVILQMLDQAANGPSPDARNALFLWILALGLILSFSLRWRLTFYALVFAFPIALYASRPFLSSVKWLVVLGCICFVGSLLFLLPGPTNDDADFSTYNDLRHAFHGTDKGDFRGKKTIQAAASVGWNPEDYLLFRSYWFLFDQNQFNNHTLARFLEANASHRERFSYKAIIKRIHYHFIGSRSYTVVFLLTIITAVIGNARRIRSSVRELKIKAFVSLAGLCSIVVFFMYYRFVPRVYLPMYAYLAGATLVFIRTLPEPSSDRAGSRVFERVTRLITLALLIIALSLTWVKIGDLADHLLNSKKTKRLVQSSLEKLKAAHPEPGKLLLVPLNPIENLHQEAVHPLREIGDLPPIPVLPAGWQINSERYFRYLQHYGLESGLEFLRWTVNNGNVVWFLVDPEKNARLIDLVEGYFQRRVVEDTVKLKNIFRHTGSGGSRLSFYSLESSSSDITPSPSKTGGVAPATGPASSE